MSRILHHVDRKDFKKTRQRQIGEQKKCDAQKLKEWQEEEEERKQIEEAARPYKSDWREEINLQESDWTPVAGSIANSSSQTFQYGGEGGPIATFSGLGGVEAYPSTVSVSGETLNTPDYSQLGMQGYAPPLGGVQRQTKQTENERIDAEIIKLEEQIKQLVQKRSDLENEQFETEPQYTGMSHGDYIDKTNEINDKWNEKTGPLGEIIYGSSSDSEKKAAYAKLDVYESARKKELDALDAEYKNQTDEHLKAQNDHFAAYTAKIDSALAKQEALRTKIAELEKQRPINQQLDASQQAYPNLPYMNARVQSAVGTLPDAPVPTPDDDVLDQVASLPGLASAKNFVDHYIDNFVQGDGKQDQNLTNLLSRSDQNWLKNALSKDPVFTNPRPLDNPQDALDRIMSRAPRGIRNSVGNGAKIDMDYYRKTGDIKLDKDYVFTQEADLEYRGLPGNALLKPLIDAPKNYAKLKMGGDISPLIQNPMRFHVVIKGPRRKKKKKEELGESTWSRLKKHR